MTMLPKSNLHILRSCGNCHKTFLLLIVILGFAVYANSINGEFIQDDYALVRNNVFTKNISYIPNIFTSDIFAGSGESRKASFYRPLQSLSYMLDYSIWGLDVKGYHITNILLHILAALSVYWFVFTIFNDRLLSLLTGLFFIIHPVHTEAVSYISGRSDPLCLLFILLSFIFYIRYTQKSRILFLICTTLSYAAALLSRESSIIFPVLLLLYHYAFRKKVRTEAVLSIVTIAVIYITLRYTALKHILPGAVYSTDLFQRITGFFAAVTNYIRLLILPVNLHMEYGEQQFSIASPPVITGILILCALIFYAYKSRDKKIVFFSISWFFITLLPQSNIYPINAYMAEHWLYIPSIGFFLILARRLCCLYRGGRYKMIAVVSTALLITGYSLMTIKQNNYWGGLLSFYEQTFKRAPGNARIYNNLAIVYCEHGRIEEAISLYRRAIELKPEYPETYINLGKAYAGLGDNKKAIEFYNKALKLDPDHVVGCNNLGIAYSTIGRKKEAVDLFKRAIEINPNYEKSYYNLALIYLASGEVEQAIDTCNRVIESNPRSVRAYHTLGVIYGDIGKPKEALSYFQKAIEADPKRIDSYLNLGAAFIAIGDLKEAESVFKKALKIDPEHAYIHNNLAVAYFNQKRYDLAIAHCDKAIEFGAEVNPEFLELLEPRRSKNES